MPLISKKRFYTVGMILVCLIGILVLANLIWSTMNRLYPNKIIDKATYQAVFLDNDQIYFGRLKDVYSQYPVLSDVYYVQVNGNASDAKSGRLVKLGESEAHGPQDEMILNKEHVLFWENLRPDSQIVQTIQTSKLKK